MPSFMPLLFALGSLACAGVSDLVFRIYARKGESVGAYVAMIGLVWLTVFSALSTPATILHAHGATLKWGLISGLCGAAANLLLIQAMAKSEAGICSTVYRLNLAPAALLAFLVLDEEPSIWKLLGIGAAVASVLFFYDLSPRQAHRRFTPLALVATAGLLRAGMGISYKWGLSQGADSRLLLALNGLVWLGIGAAYWSAVERKQVTQTARTWRYGLLSGILTLGIVFFLTLALEQADASTVLPITQLSFLVTCAFGVFFLGEELTRRKAIGLAWAVACIALMALHP